jgi:hypothetical protein
MQMAVNPKCEVMALASPFTRGDQQQITGTLSSMLKHKINLLLVRVSVLFQVRSLETTMI